MMSNDNAPMMTYDDPNSVPMMPQMLPNKAAHLVSEKLSLSITWLFAVTFF